MNVRDRLRIDRLTLAMPIADLDKDLFCPVKYCVSRTALADTESGTRMAKSPPRIAVVA